MQNLVAEAGLVRSLRGRQRSAMPTISHDATDPDATIRHAMGDASFQQIVCGECDAALDEDFALKPEKRQPCPACGSIRRHFGITLSVTATLRDSMAWKARHPGPGRPFHEGRIGSDLLRDSGEWREIERVIDRANDRYREKIVRPDGEVVRDVDEPLSEHRGHGSAKRKGAQGRRPDHRQQAVNTRPAEANEAADQ